MADRPDEAIPVLEKACALNPAALDARLSLVNACQLRSRFVDAARHCRAALDVAPGHTDFTVRLVRMLLSAGRADEAAAVARAARDSAPGNLDLARALAFALNYVDERGRGETFRAHADLGRLLDPAPRARPPRREIGGSALRVGLVSPDLRDHPVAYFIEPLLEHHDRSALHVACFSTSKDHDEFSRRLAGLAGAWHEANGLDDAALAALVAREKIDVLIDLAGLTGGNRLGVFALRAAPVQATYLGYPNTTGLSSVDFRLVDSVTDPAGSEDLCVERLVRLDPCFLCFQPARDAPEPAPPPSARSGRVTFASFNTLLKVNDATIRAWAEILSRVPGSALVLKSTQLADPQVRQGLLARFGELGVDPARLEFMQVTRTPAEHLGLYARADIALDPFPYNGTTTTCEALWMGVPVISLRGHVHAGRVGASLLSCAGVPELVTPDVAAYVDAAAALAGDSERLGRYRASLRATVAASPLLDGRGFSRRMEGALRRMYADA